MQVTLAVVADYANKTADGKLNLMGMFGRITAKSVPAVHPQMYLAIIFALEPAERGSEKQIEIKLLDADGNVMMGLSGTLAIPEDAPLRGEMHHIIRLVNTVFPTFGDYEFHILINGETKASRRLTVRQRGGVLPPAAEPNPQ